MSSIPRRSLLAGSIFARSTNLQGIFFLILGMGIFSLQNIAVRFLDTGYALMEIVLIRSLVAIPCILILFRYEGRTGLPTTNRLGLQMFRGFLLFVAYTTYFMGLAAIPLAEVAAIRFSAPFFVLALSVLLLGEHVDWQRWAAVVVGFIGVLFVVRPGTYTFDIGAVYVLITSLTYAMSSIITRWLKTTDSSATMAYYCTLTYLGCATILSPILIFVGEPSEAHPTIGFLLRSWATPTMVDFGVMVALGIIWATGMYSVARAYSLAPASVVTPFEFTVIPINIFWGYLFWAEIPVSMTIFGIVLTIMSGLFVLYRDSGSQRKTV